MDDFFQILIYILIAVSFLSSLFKKKKPVQPPPENEFHQDESKQLDEPVTSKPISTEQKTEQPDFLKELESFFSLDVPEVPPKKEPPVKHDDKEVYRGAQNRADYKTVPEDSFHKQTESEHTFIDPWDKKRKAVEEKQKRITPEIEEQAASYRESFEKEDAVENEIVYNIRNGIQHPASLKEYIIFSEIIGKPKAWRR
ncbi:MAG: hypothetical protein PVF17_09100 [Ignavibacteria bacterium]|jgi:hypothetical protein